MKEIFCQKHRYAYFSFILSALLCKFSVEIIEKYVRVDDCHFCLLEISYGEFNKIRLNMTLQKIIRYDFIVIVVETNIILEKILCNFL